MNDQGRTNPERIEELPVLKQRIKILKQSESKSKEIATVYSFLILFMIVVMLFVGGLASSTCNAASNSQEVRVGSELDFPPYAFVDESGQADGFSVELIKAVTNTMGLSIKISTGLWDTMWNSLVSGQIDVLPIVAKLPERQHLVDFSLPHTETFDAFFVRKGDPAIQNIAAVRGKEIVVMRSDAAHHALLERNFQGKLILVDTIPAGLSLISSGKHDAFLCSKLIGTLSIKEHGITGLTAGPLIPDYKRVFSFAVKKGDTELLEKLNQGLLIVKTNGEYDRIYHKWLSFDDPWRKVQKYLLPIIITVIAIAVIAGFWLVMLQRLVRKRTRELAEKNKMLLHAYDDLEARIQERTAELAQPNQLLQAEITEYKRAEEALRESEARYRELFDNISSGVAIYEVKDNGNDYIFKDFNKAGERLDGDRKEDIIGKSIYQARPGIKEFGLLNVFKRVWETGIPEHYPASFYEDERLKKWLENYVYKLPTGDIVAVYDNVTDRKLAEEALRESENRYRDLSIVDDLTQLYNSRHFYHQIKMEIARADRYGQPLTLLLLDLDDFKQFNDAYGHIEGDQVLLRLGQVVKRCLRQTDSAYRYGGEEFTILLPMTTDRDCVVTAERIRTEFKKEIFSPAPGQDVHLTVSIGFAQYKPQEDMKAFVHRVDQLMYQGKKTGKDRVCSEP